jgi:serine phosphatase RsbU (regulator of sigma subunit)
VVEAMNAKKELFGFERTRAISGKSADEIAAAAQAFGQEDDITVLTIQRTASAQPIHPTVPLSLSQI